MATKKTDDDVKKVHGLVGKPSNGRNSPVIGDKGLEVEPGDNAKYLSVSMYLMELPKINIKDAEEVKNRLNEYFSFMVEKDMKPTVAGMGMALGLDRRRLWEIKTGNFRQEGGGLADLPPAVTDSIKRAYLLMENLWENYMQNGKINPVSGIFLGKNNYGYQDKTEYVLTPNAQNEPYDPEDIKSRYLVEAQEPEETDSTENAEKP